MCVIFLWMKNIIGAYHLYYLTNNRQPLHGHWYSKLPSFITWSPDPCPPIPGIAGLIHHMLPTPARGRQINRIHNNICVSWCESAWYMWCKFPIMVGYRLYYHIPADTCALSEEMHTANIYNHIYHVFHSTHIHRILNLSIQQEDRLRISAVRISNYTPRNEV